MITLALAYINAKLKHDYELLFLGTVFIDITLVEAIYKAFN